MDENVIEALSSQENLLSAINEVKKEIVQESLRDEKKTKIEMDILRLLPNCRVHFYGSQVIGLATKKSDIDIYIDHDGRSFSVALNREDEKKILEELLYEFNIDGSGFDMYYYLPDARVPLIHVIHQKTEIRCDITCRSGLSVETAKLTRVLLFSDFRVSWLVITIKWWMNANNLLGSQKFNSYATTWLVYFFLMQIQPNILKPVGRMKQELPRRIVGGWECQFDSNFYPNKYQPRNNKNKRIKLLAEFFKYYGHFDFQRVVLCTLNGTVMLRTDFDTLKLSPEFSGYVEKVRRNPSDRLLTSIEDYPICVQDPLELSHNITKVVKYGDLNKFQTFCRASLECPALSQYRF